MRIFRHTAIERLERVMPGDLGGSTSGKSVCFTYQVFNFCQILDIYCVQLCGKPRNTTRFFHQIAGYNARMA